jgi:hypothetical protein
MFRYKDYFGLSANLGITFNAYAISSGRFTDRVSYEFAHYCPKLSLSPFVIIPWKNNPHSEFRIQTTMGYHFINNDQAFENILGLQAKTTAFEQVLPFIKPEFGLTKFLPKMQMDLGVSYHHPFANVPVLEVALSNNNNNQAFAEADMRYLAVTVRLSPEVHFFKKGKINNQSIETMPAKLISEEIKGRTTRERKPIEFSGKKVVLKVWDNSEIDGDIVSIALNERYILENYTLKRKKKRIKIKLTAIIKLLKGPARATSISLNLLCMLFGLISTGFAHPIPIIKSIRVPAGSRCEKGLRDNLP